MTTTRLRLAFLGVVALAAAALGADCNGDVLQDSLFQDYCGGDLCHWATNAGETARVPTWTQDDYGLSFLTTGTQISQLTGEDAARCLVFSATGDIDPSAAMMLLLDFDNDGTIDYQTPIPATHWRNVQVEITAPPLYKGITFIIRKEGTGTAILAELRAISTTGCTAPPVVLPPVGFGAPCAAPTDCDRALVCAPNGMCGECDDDAPCDDGGTCVKQDYVPWQCNPGQHLTVSGAPCTSGADCASGICDGSDLQSFATLFATDSGCPTDVPCEPDAAIDGSMSACACYLGHGGTCR